tara:strand:- start:184 stop:402 length:219 start_codon:yes stop_codon:yes gene_type:complete
LIFQLKNEREKIPLFFSLKKIFFIMKFLIFYFSFFLLFQFLLIPKINQVERIQNEKMETLKAAYNYLLDENF